MTFVAAKCPSCYADTQVPSERPTAKCMYCGADIDTQAATKLAAGRPDVLNYLRLADAALKAQNHEEAETYFTRVLEHDPANYLAWYGKAISAGWLSTTAAPRMAEMVQAINRAIELAPEDKRAPMRRSAAGDINSVSVAIFGLTQKIVTQFATSDTHLQFLSRCEMVLKALEIAHSYGPQDKQIVANLIVIQKAYMMRYYNELTKEYHFLTDVGYSSAVGKLSLLPLHALFCSCGVTTCRPGA